MRQQDFFIECRSEVKDGTLTGYASIFGAYADLGSYLETFAPTAFNATLADSACDVRAFYQHNSEMLLGRQSSGTLKLWIDSTGLGYELDLPKTSYANDVRELAARGDLAEMSIGFIPGKEEPGTLGNRRLRTHTSIARLVEISPVSIAAYSSTTAQLRSLADIPTTTAATDLRTQIALAKVRARQPKGK